MSEVVRTDRRERPYGVWDARCLRALMLAAALSATAAHAKCTVQRLPDIPVTMEGTVPMVHAQINGSDALFIADSGAFFSMVTPSAAAQFQMKRDPRYRSLLVTGVGGLESAEVLRAKSFTIMGYTVPDVDFVESGVRVHNASGLLGQNVFRIGDVEYDLANGIIRILQPKDCKDTVLAYWAAAERKPYSVISIDFASAQEPHTVGVAYLNGTKIHVLFDTGAARSVLTLEAAKRAGTTPKSPGVEEGGSEYGIGGRVTPAWIARFASFKLGDEEIDHARLRFADIVLNADMLIGADFFLSHHIYVASSQRKLYFTYNGGPVFDLEKTRESPEPADAGATDAGAAPGGPTEDESGKSRQAPPAEASINEPTDAAGFARRGAASAARHDYGPAIADLTRACALAPAESSYFYQRGMIHWHNGRGDLALADLDQAIKLKADDVPSRVARAEFKAGSDDAAGATADLEAADAAAARDSDQRLRIASVYESLDKPAAARAQLSNWIDTHRRDDTRMAGVLNSRCREGALSGQALDQALSDCNAALRGSRSEPAAFLDSRGLVYLRLGNYEKAIKDYDAALRTNPRSAWSLYGRGLARLRAGNAVAGQADVSAANAQDPKIAERAAKFGIAP